MPDCCSFILFCQFIIQFLPDTVSINHLPVDEPNTHTDETRINSVLLRVLVILICIYLNMKINKQTNKEKKT